MCWTTKPLGTQHTHYDFTIGKCHLSDKHVKAASKKTSELASTLNAWFKSLLFSRCGYSCDYESVKSLVMWRKSTYFFLMAIIHMNFLNLWIPSSMLCVDQRRSWFQVTFFISSCILRWWSGEQSPSSGCEVWMLKDPLHWRRRSRNLHEGCFIVFSNTMEV